MLDHEIPTDRKPARVSEPEEFLGMLGGPITTPGDVVPIAPNVIATIISFGFMVIAPWLVLSVVDWIIGDSAALDEAGPGFLAIAVGITMFVALGVALLFLVIGMIIQFWQHHKPFASWWPVALAFPAAWGLLLPETLVRGGPVMYWIILGAAIALAFSVHWLALVVAREAME